MVANQWIFICYLNDILIGIEKEKLPVANFLRTFLQSTGSVRVIAIRVPSNFYGSETDYRTDMGHFINVINIKELMEEF